MIRIATNGVLHDTAFRLDPALQSLMQKSDCHMTSFWVPGSILRAVLPSLVKYFKGKQVVLPVDNYPNVSFKVSSTPLYKSNAHRSSHPLLSHCPLLVDCLLTMPLVFLTG